MDVIRQKERRKALSVSAAPSQLSQRESQGAVSGSILSAQVIITTPPERHIGRSLQTLTNEHK